MPGLLLVRMATRDNFGTLILLLNIFYFGKSNCVKIFAILRNKTQPHKAKTKKKQISGSLRTQIITQISLISQIHGILSHYSFVMLVMCLSSSLVSMQSSFENNATCI